MEPTSRLAGPGRAPNLQREEETRPVRNAISRTRLKLNRMGLGVFQLGSILVARPPLRQGLVHQERARKTRTPV